MTLAKILSNGGVHLGTISVKIYAKVTHGQGTKWSRKIAENFNRLSRAHEHYRRQTTDGRAATYGEHEREFTFANNYQCKKLIILKHSVRATYVTPLKQQKSLCLTPWVQNCRCALRKRAAVLNICSTCIC